MYTIRSKSILWMSAIVLIGNQLIGKYSVRRTETFLPFDSNDIQSNTHVVEGNNTSSYLDRQQPQRNEIVGSQAVRKSIILDDEAKISTEDDVENTIDKINTTKRKPHLVFHVGPPKTATTTIQATMALWESNGILLKDNYRYAGFTIVDGKRQDFSPMEITVSNKLRDYTCNRQMSNARKKAAHNATLLHEIVAAVPCAMNILEALNPFAQNGTNILVSDESYSFNWITFYGMPHKGALDWISLKALLSPYWNIAIIVAYRRYYEWLPSAKQQVERWKPSKPKMNAWPPNGKDIETLFPDFWRRVKIPGTIDDMPYHFTDTNIQSIQQANQNVNEDPINVVIFNLHELSEINNFTSPFVRTNFVCNALPAASNICEYSRKLDLQMNNETKENPSQTTSYDRLIMAAARKNMINTDTAIRHDVVLAAQQYHEGLLAAAENTTEVEFPLICPSKLEVRALMRRSLIYEREILPTFYRSPHGRERHMSDFWNAVEKKKFCDVDVDVALKQQHWQNFFNTAQSE